MTDPNPTPIPWRIETERLALIGPDIADAEAVNVGVCESVAELTPWMPWMLGGQTVAQTREYFTKATNQFESREAFHWNLWRREAEAPRTPDAFIGCCSLPRLDWSVPKFEIGYWVRTSCAGRGYIGEAVAAITALCFEQLGARRVEIRCSAKNLASRRVAERAGYPLEAILRNDTRGKNGELRDTAMYVKTR